MNALLGLAFEKSDRVAHFGREAEERAAAVSAMPASPCWIKNARRFRIDRCRLAVELFAEKFAAVIDAAHEHQLRLVPDQHRALLVTHVEEEESFVGEHLRVGELESVEGTNRRELKNAGGASSFCVIASEICFTAGRSMPPTR